MTIACERDDFSECPLSFRTANDAVLERQPSSLHTPSHLTVWLVFQMGKLYSADTPLSVSRRELQGNWPVTLYKFTEKLGDNGTLL